MAAAALLAGSRAQAQSAETAADLRCVLAVQMVANQSKDAKLVQQAAMGMLFFMGRIQGREPSFDVAPALRAEMLKTSFTAMKPEIARCGQILAGEGAKIKAAEAAYRSMPHFIP